MRADRVKSAADGNSVCRNALQRERPGRLAAFSGCFQWGEKIVERPIKRGQRFVANRDGVWIHDLYGVGSCAVSTFSDAGNGKVLEISFLDQPRDLADPAVTLLGADLKRGVKKQLDGRRVAGIKAQTDTLIPQLRAGDMPENSQIFAVIVRSEIFAVLLRKAHRPFAALLRQGVGIGGRYPAGSALGCTGVGTVFPSVTRRVGREFAASLHQLFVGVIQGVLFVLQRDAGIKIFGGAFRSLGGITLKSVGAA